jgi:hypothetical protein
LVNILQNVTTFLRSTFFGTNILEAFIFVSGMGDSGGAPAITMEVGSY